MGTLPESTMNLLLSGIMGMMGGLITIPINAIVAQWLKRDALLYQHKLDLIAKKRELLLQHQLEMERKAKDERQDEINQFKKMVEHLEARVASLERMVSYGD